MHHLTDRMAHTTAFVLPVVEHWLERFIIYFFILYMWICGTGHSVKDHSDSERKPAAATSLILLWCMYKIPAVHLRVINIACTQTGICLNFVSQ